MHNSCNFRKMNIIIDHQYKVYTCSYIWESPLLGHSLYTLTLLRDTQEYLSLHSHRLWSDIVSKCVGSCSVFMVPLSDLSDVN